MSEHINKLACGPRALLILAEKIGHPIDPDILWERFCKPGEKIVKANGAIYLSAILDMAREYGIASQMCVTRDIEIAASASAASAKDATGQTNVAGVLMATELAPNSSGQGFSRNPHVWVVHQILEDIKTKQSFVETESASLGEPSRVYTLPDVAFDKMWRTFLVLVK